MFPNGRVFTEITNDKLHAGTRGPTLGQTIEPYSESRQMDRLNSALLTIPEAESRGVSPVYIHH